MCRWQEINQDFAEWLFPLGGYYNDKSQSRGEKEVGRDREGESSRISLKDTFKYSKQFFSLFWRGSKISTKTVKHQI